MAANDHIKIDPTASFASEANELLTFIRTLRQAYELGTRIRAKMRHNFTDGGTVNWAAVQTLWGIASNGTDTGDASNGNYASTK